MKHLAKLIVINALIASVFATIVAAQNIKHLHSIHPSLQRQAKLNMAYGLYDELS